MHAVQLSLITMSPEFDDDTQRHVGAEKTQLLVDKDGNPRDRNIAKASWLLNAIIGELTATAAKRGISSDDLRRAYRENATINNFYIPRSGSNRQKVAPEAISFETREITSYSHLFGFRQWVRNYAAENGKLAKSDLKERHIKTINDSLQLLKIYGGSEAPIIASETHTWPVFLEFALEAIMRFPQPATTLLAEQAAPLKPTGNSSSLEKSPIQVSLALQQPLAALEENTDFSLTLANGVRDRASADTEISKQNPRKVILSSAPRRLAALVTLLLFAISIIYVTARPFQAGRSRNVETSATTLSAAASAGTAKTPFFDGDPRFLIGSHLTLAQSNQNGGLRSDARLEEAKQLRADGKDNDADKLIAKVVEEANLRRIQSSRDEADGHRLLGDAAYYSYSNYDGAIAEWEAAAALDEADHDATAKDFNNIGLAYIGKGELVTAFSKFSEAIRRRPKAFAWPYSNRGNMYMMIETPDPGRAIADYTEAIKIDDKFEPAWNGLGNALSENNDFRGASSSYKNAIEIDPNDPNPYLGLGYIYYRQGMFAEAIASYDEALKRAPEVASALVMRGFSKLSSGDAQHAFDDFDEAIASFNKASKVDQRKLLAEAYLGRGEARNIAGNFKNALSDFDISLNLDPTSAPARAGRGLVFAHLSQYDDAFTDYEAAIRSDRTYSPVYFARAELYRSLGQTANALSDIESVLKLHPSDPIAHFLRATIRVDQGDTAGAETDIDAATGASPGKPLSFLIAILEAENKRDVQAALSVINALLSDPSATSIRQQLQIFRANIYSRVGRTSEAVKDLDAALEAFPESIELHLKRGDLWAKLPNEHEKAKADFDLAISLNPTAPEGYIKRGNLYLKNEEFALAIPEYRSAIKYRAQPGELAATYLNLGYASARIGRFDDALEEYDNAVKLNVSPFDLEGEFRRARLLAAIPKFDLAIAEYTKIIESHPRSAEAFAGRAFVYRAAGKYEASAEDFTNQAKIDARRAYRDRGNTYYLAQDFNRAIESYDLDIRENPGSYFGYLERGRAYEAKKQLDQAIADYETAVRLEPILEAAVLRLYHARALMSPDRAQQELEENARRLDSKDSEYPIVQLNLGRLSVDDLMLSDDALCTVGTYLSDWYTLHDNMSAAREILDKTVQACPLSDGRLYDALAAKHLVQ